MPELRWALVGLGVLFITGLALWEWRRGRRRPAHSAGELGAAGATPQPGGEWARRIEPRIDSVFEQGARAHDNASKDEVPVIHPSGLELTLPVAPESAVDIPGAMAFAAPAPTATASAFPPPNPPRASLPTSDQTPGETGESRESAESAESADVAQAAQSAEPDSWSGPVEAPHSDAPRHLPEQVAPSRKAATQPTILWPPERADRVLTLRLANAQGALLQGRAVRLALEQAGLVHGPQCIYHRVDVAGNVLASAANMLRPGDLDPLLMDEQQFRGLSLFSVLPGALPPVRMLEELVALARAIAWRVGAVVQDDHGDELDGDRLVKLRQSLPDAAEHGLT